MGPTPSNRILVLVLATVALGGCLAGTSPEDTGSDEIQLTGETKVFDLYIRTCQHTPYPNTTFLQWCFSDSPDGEATVPGPEIRATAGDKVKIKFHNQMSNFAHTVHWHGIHLDWKMDGVPYVSQDPVQPGETFTYEFIAKPGGTFWYHCHVNAEHDVDMGMYGPIVIEPQDDTSQPAYDQEETLMFSAFNKYHTTGINPAGSNLPNNGDPLSYEEWTRQQVEGVNRNQQYQQAVRESGVKKERDWYPKTHAAYKPQYNTFMLNGRSFPWTDPILVEEGQRVKLRLISVNTFTTWHLHGHYMQVTHKDGALLPAPYKADTLLVAPGERYSVIVEANNPGIWAMHSHSPGHVQNDWVYPGGQLTTFVYEQFADQARRVDDQPSDQNLTAGQFMQVYR